MDYFDRILGIEDKTEDGTAQDSSGSDKKTEKFISLDDAACEKTSCDKDVCGRTCDGTESSGPDELFGITGENGPEKDHSPSDSGKRKGSSRQMWLSIAVIFVLIPLVFIICYKSGDKRLYIGSIIIMILAMVPFFVNFEHRKPDARELVTLSVLTAVAIVSRVAFMWLPAFKPMAGFIVITAMCFGPQAGFMTGALSMLLSNIIFGQGPWTPWQMFCYGMIGFLGGILARPGIISVRHLIRSGIIAFFTVTILSSVVLDSSTLFFMFSKISKASILTVYISGFPINVLNGIASGLAVVLLSRPISVIIARIRRKYDVNKI